MGKDLELRAQGCGIGDRGIGSDVERLQVVRAQDRTGFAAMRACNADGDARCVEEFPADIAGAGRRIEHLLQHGAGEGLSRVDAEFAEDAAHGLPLSKRNARGFPKNRRDFVSLARERARRWGGKRTFLLCLGLVTPDVLTPTPGTEELEVGSSSYLGSSRTFGPVRVIGTPLASEPLQSLRAVCSMLFVLHQRVCGVTVCDPPGWMTMARSVATPVLVPSKKFTRSLMVIVVPPVLRRTCAYCHVWGSEHPCAGGSL